jgi:hypothetical protein
MNPGLERHSAIRSMTKDIAGVYGSYIVCNDIPDSARPLLEELAHLAERDFVWAVSEVIEEYEYERDGGYL